MSGAGDGEGKWGFLTVTGSTHCMIVPYWAEKLGKTEIVAYQASERSGTLYAKLAGDRVKIAGKAVLFSVAELNV